MFEVLLLLAPDFNSKCSKKKKALRHSTINWKQASGESALLFMPVQAIVL